MKRIVAALLVVACSLLFFAAQALAAAKDPVPAGKNAATPDKAPAWPDKAPAWPDKDTAGQKGGASAEKGRSLAFNKQNVYVYFRQVEEAKSKLPEDMQYQELRDRQCHLYASVLKQGGYDFEATIISALERSNTGGNKLDDPRFMFLAGVFQEHPDQFLRLRLISKSTRDAVVRYFGN